MVSAVGGGREAIISDWEAGGSQPEPKFIWSVNNSALAVAGGGRLRGWSCFTGTSLLSSYWLAARTAASNWLSEAAMTLVP